MERIAGPAIYRQPALLIELLNEGLIETANET